MNLQYFVTPCPFPSDKRPFQSVVEQSLILMWSFKKRIVIGLHNRPFNTLSSGLLTEKNAYGCVLCPVFKLLMNLISQVLKR